MCGRMEYYQLGQVKTASIDPFSDLSLDENVVHMKVQANSRMQNLLGFAINKIKMDDTKQMVWLGEGVCAQKASNCADVMKRKVKNLYMLSREFNKRAEEYWEPIYMEGLDRLVVCRDTKVIAVLLSKIPLDSFKEEIGYYGIDEAPSVPTKSTSADSSTGQSARRGHRQRPKKSDQKSKDKKKEKKKSEDSYTHDT